MHTYQDPNAVDDSPIKKQIFMVLAGFAMMTAVIAVVINVVV